MRCVRHSMIPDPIRRIAFHSMVFNDPEYFQAVANASMQELVALYTNFIGVDCVDNHMKFTPGPLSLYVRR